ncbi:MAG: amylo-alpha-1,6-glucosidase [Planctomycetota bacterium]
MTDLVMEPAPGGRVLRFVGDRIAVRLHASGAVPKGWKALLRTNIGRAKVLRDEIIASLGGARTFAGASWRDIPMRAVNGGWEVELPLAEVGWFRAKAYCLDEKGRQHWPNGDDLGVVVHPDDSRSGNTIYCAFTRMFGRTKEKTTTSDSMIEDQLAAFDRNGYTVIPPSGTLRDLQRELPHIIDRLGCRILHLLPVTPTPTTYARMGRFGSPYAAQDLTGIDPALVEFDKRTTGIDQFRELTYAVHLKGARVFLDIAINHTGWGSTLLERHPEWFQRNADGTFKSPGAWGTVWGDLVELRHADSDLWEALAEAFLTWCQRGVDGFRCDAGYMVPLPAWRYITARVRQEFPETVFLLEGLGGSWEATETLLTIGCMQWAYSELFQNYDGPQVSTYLDHCLSQSTRVGLLVHYSETHDNERLAQRDREWSLMRNRLCALASPGGAFGFTCGVEWLATERLNVHQSRGMSWGASRNLVDELARLNRLIADHPCFHADAQVTRLSPDGSPLLALRRDSSGAGGVMESVLVLVNLDTKAKQSLRLNALIIRDMGSPATDLLGQNAPALIPQDDGTVSIGIGPSESYCLAGTTLPQGLAGQEYRAARAQAACAMRVLCEVLPPEHIGPADWQGLAQRFAADPVRFIAATTRLDQQVTATDLLAAIDAVKDLADLPCVTVITSRDLTRVVPIPPGHWLLVRDAAPFAAAIQRPQVKTPGRARSLPVNGGHVAVFPPASAPGTAQLLLERFTVAEGAQARVRITFLPATPDPAVHRPELGLALLTNGRGAMSRLYADLGQVRSKYDCLLGANLHPDAPCDRHVFAKRLRAWVNADGFITPLDSVNLSGFAAGPPVVWNFIASAGAGRVVELRLSVDLLEGRNAVVALLERLASDPSWGDPLPASCLVSVTVRVDVEDRSFHSETIRSAEVEAHFVRSTTSKTHGFVCAFAGDRRLRVHADDGVFHAEPEWSEGIPHPIEAGRGMQGSGDAWSPGWFELVLKPGAATSIVLDADAEALSEKRVRAYAADRHALVAATVARAKLPADDEFGRRLAASLQAFVVQRGDGKTVIAGYPWFLDWGRDTFIAARGMLAAGLDSEVVGLLRAFGRFIDRGTLPNLLNGDEAQNRDTSDAPLWYALAAEEWVAKHGKKSWNEEVAPGRSLRSALADIAVGWIDGTPNGIRVDHASALAWSPPHFTWMDTNYPACTPRAGYPIEIQALWIRLLRQLDRAGAPAPRGPWADWATRAQAALERFWLEPEGWLSDCLLAADGRAAADALPDRCLRPNMLFAISLGLVDGMRARRCAAAAERFLLVPGALRTLAPLSVDPPLEIRAADGRMLADPLRPYQGHYEGDEDTRRKPAYHNGTAWPWLLPTFCEAVVRAWDGAPTARSAARAWLGSADLLLDSNCLGQLPEIIDGDAPHTQRGCDAQAWSVSETLRVWRLINEA